MKKMATILPEKYVPKIDFFGTERGIKFLKDFFEKRLAEKLSLTRVSAPRFITTTTGLQDDLAGTQVPVSFDTKFCSAEIVHSLAKWKRFALGKYGFSVGTGLYTDMDAIRKDEDISPIHSVYVDQWDWEKIISKEDRTIDLLKKTVTEIYEAIRETKKFAKELFSELTFDLPKEITFVHTSELEKEFPDFSPKEREHAIAKRHKAVFIIGIGGTLPSGKIHDVRAADYDDWSLDGDIIVWDYMRKDSLELSSMGIRVDKDVLLTQLKACGLLERKELEFHKGILEETLPLTIGGGIGQSRLCMFLLEKAHIGEVQSSVWPKEVEEAFKEKGVVLL
jgi:aspartate--ammonia ligase